MKVLNQEKKNPYFWPTVFGAGLAGGWLLTSLGGRKGEGSGGQASSSASTPMPKGIATKASPEKSLNHYQFFVINNDSFSENFSKLQQIQEIFQAYVYESQYGQVVLSGHESKDYRGFTYSIEPNYVMHPLSDSSTAPYLKRYTEAKKEAIDLDGVLFRFVEEEANH